MPPKLGSGSTEFNPYAAVLYSWNSFLAALVSLLIATAAQLLCYFLPIWIEYAMTPPNNKTT